ncbi:MAG: CBS domain-containing protein [Elusimicrobiota bacterium]
MQVKQLMTGTLDCVGPGCSVKEAARRMARRHTGMLAVLGGKRMTGIVTARDIVVRVVAKGASLVTTKVGDIMTRAPVFCHDEDDIGAAAKSMQENHVRRMPVRNRREQLVGLLSVDDFAKKIAGQAIGAEVLEAMAEHSG